MRNLESSEEYQFEDGEIDKQASVESDYVASPPDDEPKLTEQHDAFWIRYNQYVTDGLSHDEIMAKLS